MNDIMCPACGLYVCQHSEKLCELLKTAKQHESDVQHVGMPFSSIRSQILPSPEDVGRSKGAAAMTAENKRRERPVAYMALTVEEDVPLYRCEEADALFEKLEAENHRLRSALTNFYDAWEKGTSCYEADGDGVIDEGGSSLGNAVKLSFAEEQEILNLIVDKAEPYEQACANCGKPYRAHLLHDGNKCNPDSTSAWFPGSIAVALKERT